MSKKWAKNGVKFGKNCKKDTRNVRVLSKSERFLYNFFQVPAQMIDQKRRGVTYDSWPVDHGLGIADSLQFDDLSFSVLASKAERCTAMGLSKPSIEKPKAFLNGASPLYIQLCTKWKKPGLLKADGNLQGSSENENTIILLPKAGSY